MKTTEWLNSLKQDRNPSPHTIRSYKTAFRSFQGFMEKKDISNATERDIRAYIATLKAQGNTRSTIYQRLVPLKCYFKTLHESGANPNTPFAMIRYTAGVEEVNRQRAEAQRKLLTVEQVKSLLSFDWSLICKGNDTDDERRKVRNAMIVYLLCDTGRRVADICRVLRWDVDTQGKQIIFNHTKSSTGQGVSPVSDKTLALIRNYLDLTEDCGNCKNKRWFNGYLLDINEHTVRRNVGYALEVLNIKKKNKGLNAHAINHFFISHAREKGVQIDELAGMTGKSIRTLLKIYDHPSTNRIRQAHRKASVVA